MRKKEDNIYRVIKRKLLTCLLVCERIYTHRISKFFISLTSCCSFLSALLFKASKPFDNLTKVQTHNATDTGPKTQHEHRYNKQRVQKAIPRIQTKPKFKLLPL